MTICACVLNAKLYNDLNIIVYLNRSVSNLSIYILCISLHFNLFILNSFIYYPKYVKYAFYTVKSQNMLKYSFM